MQYLNRDQPTFLERYAELVALLFSVAVVLLGAAGSVMRMLRRTKKDRIDVYYQKVQDVEQRLLDSEDDVRAAQRELEQLKALAVQQLQEERLQANESFSIFLDLLHHQVARLEKRLGRASGAS